MDAAPTEGTCTQTLRVIVAVLRSSSLVVSFSFWASIYYRPGGDSESPSR